MNRDPQAVQRGNLVSRLRPPTSAVPPTTMANAGSHRVVGADDEEEVGYDPDKDIFDKQQAAIEADAAERRRRAAKGKGRRVAANDEPPTNDDDYTVVKPTPIN